MKKILALMTIAFATLLAGCAESDVPQEGKQFKTLPVNLSTFRLPQVAEVFHSIVATVKNGTGFASIGTTHQAKHW